MAGRQYDSGAIGKQIQTALLHFRGQGKAQVILLGFLVRKSLARWQCKCPDSSPDLPLVEKHLVCKKNRVGT